MDDAYDYLFNLSILGDSRVGKTCMFSRLCEQRFDYAYQPTVGVDFKYRSLNIHEKKIKLAIRDLAGAERFRGIVLQYITDLHGIILMYDVTNVKSFENLGHWMAEIKKLHNMYISDKEIMIIGNKCDLSDSRVISTERGESLADEYGARFMETSAKNKINVEEAIYELTYDLLMNELNVQDEKNKPYNKKRLIRNLNKAKRNHGTIPVRFLKIIVAGSGAAGKTNFINLLMKKKFNENHHSTNVAHANHAVSVSFQMATFQESSEIDDEITWVELDSKLEIGYLRSILLPEKQMVPFAFFTEVEYTAEATLASTKAPIKVSHLSKKRHSSILSKLAGFFVSSIKHSNLSSVDSILNMDSSESDKSGASIFQPGGVLNIITLLDTGGQPEYIHLLPTININPTITFFVHNLYKKLSDQVLVEYSQNGKHIFAPYHLSYSNLDMIKFLMSTVHDSEERPSSSISDLQLAVKPGTDNKSYICMIGTHADKVSHTDKKETNKNLTSLVNQTQCHASIWYQEDKNVLFAVDNTTSGTDTEDPVAKDIRSRIETIASKKEIYELPVTWMLLQLEIRQVCSKEKKSYITFNECVAIAKKSSLISNKQEVKSVLQYHHILGVLIYFHEVPGLCDYVIVDHQWWFDKLSSVICITFQEDHLDYQAVRKLKYQGMLSTELVKHVKWKDDDIINEEFFFSLLIRMKIITPVHSKQGCREYFIPFVLSAYNLKQENNILSQYGHLQREPLLIQFHSGLLPRGLFCSLLVQLLQNPLKGLEPHFSQEEKQHAFSNLFTFSLPNAYSVSLLDKLSYLEVQIRHPERAFDIPIHAQVYDYMMHILKDVCNHLNFNFETLQYGFLCKCCKCSEDHIAIIPSISSSLVYAKCSIDTTCQIKLGPSHFIWFSYDQHPQSKNDILKRSHTIKENLPPKPTFTVLIDYLEGVVSWEAVAAHLLSDSDGSKVETIARNNCYKIQKCRTEMLREYFRSGEISWEVVLEALMKANERSTADKIKQML